jgi:prevent-host-death family protein
LIRELVAEDKVAFIQKHGKPMAVVISYDRYKRLLERGIDVNED